jgi:hypothetical protein
MEGSLVQGSPGKLQGSPRSRDPWGRSKDPQGSSRDPWGSPRIPGDSQGSQGMARGYPIQDANASAQLFGTIYFVRYGSDMFGRVLYTSH